MPPPHKLPAKNWRRCSSTLEKRAIFDKLRNLGQRALSLREGETPYLVPISEVGGGGVQEREKASLREIIEKLHALFGSETPGQDHLVYVNHVIKGKLLESETLRQQAASNSKE